MQLPANVRRIVEERVAQAGFAAVKAAAEAMSEAYRAGRPPGNLPHRAEAYLVTRMPATYAAAAAVLRELRADIGSILDVGAGTGAASLAARERSPNAAVTMIERDRELAAAARLWLPDAVLLIEDAGRMPAFSPHDLVIASYSLGEFSSPQTLRLWDAARVALVIIEPGTTAGFARILRARAELLAAGARIVAPCPAETPCPMAAPDWCHFGARVDRSSLHRRIKDAELGYEDEKYSYVAVAREASALAAWRVIRRPEQRPGLIVLETCTPEGLRTRRIPKRHREEFRAARKTGWGDAGVS